VILYWSVAGGPNPRHRDKLTERERPQGGADGMPRSPFPKSMVDQKDGWSQVGTDPFPS
jgi:hypothetical protein